MKYDKMKISSYKFNNYKSFKNAEYIFGFDNFT